jgi:hypothetical protein
MKRRQRTVTVNGRKTTWYIVENENGARAESKTKDYKRLERILNEQTK